MKHKLPSARVARSVGRAAVRVGLFSVGAVGGRSPVAVLGGSNMVTPSSARVKLATQRLRVMREDRMRMPALCIECN